MKPIISRLKIKDLINKSFNKKRFAFFLKQLDKLNPQDNIINILDIGGTEYYWERMNFVDNKNIRITLLNLEKYQVKYSNFSSIKGNACDLSRFSDKSYDIVYSNSVIEHLFSFCNQKKMAAEVKRVGKFYYIQTPNRYFPIEPHWYFPFFQFLPFGSKVFLTRFFNLGFYNKTKNKETAISRVKEVNLLSLKELKSLFPDGCVFKEKFLGLTKSITVYKFGGFN